jgi:hypothetical protein
MTKDTCLPQDPETALQSLLLQEIPQTTCPLRIAHSHAKGQCHKIRNNTPIITNKNKSYTKLIYSSRRTHGYKTLKTEPKRKRYELYKVQGLNCRKTKILMSYLKEPMG